MDDPTKKTIISGEASVTETDNPTISMRKVIVPDENLTLDGLMESWKFSPELKERCIVMCANYAQGPENFSRCLDLMDYVAQSDSSKENFPSIAPHLPAIFSLPAQDQEELLTVIGENINQGNFPSAYKCILETHEEALRARVYSGLERLGLTQSDLDNQYIWNSLNSVFLGYTFLQNVSFEDQDESQEYARRLDFLEQLVPHYLDAAKLIPTYLVAEKPEEAKAIARRIAVEYTHLYGIEGGVEGVFEQVNKYTLQEIEKESKKVQREGGLSSPGQEDELPILESEDNFDALKEELTTREKTIRSLQELLGMANSSITDLSKDNTDLKKMYLESVSEEKHKAVLDDLEAARKQTNASAEEAAALRKQYSEYISPAAHRTALENESHALKAQYDQYISLKEYHAKATEWNATKRKLEDAVKEAKKASAPSGSGRWKLAAALGALGVSLAAGGVLYFSEARQNEELSQWVEKLNAGNQECVKANNSLLQEGKGLARKVSFYEKPTATEKVEPSYQSCSKSLNAFSLEELEKLTGDIAKQWEADDYDHLIRQKELNFWLDSMHRVYGVEFTKETKK